MKQTTETLFKDINHLHTENIGNAQRTAENAVLIGVKFQQLKEILPHGEFEKAATKATKVSDQTRTRYMRLAEERLIEIKALKLISDGKAPDGKSSTVELLSGAPMAVELYEDPDLQAIPSDVRAVAAAEVRSEHFKWTAMDVKPKELARGLEGKDVGDLFRDYDIIRAKKPKQHVAPRELSPEENVAAENAQAEALVQAAQVALQVLINDLQSKTGNLAVRIQTKLWKDIIRTTTQFNKLARPLAKRKLSAAEKQQEKQAKAKSLLAAVESCAATLNAGKITPEAKSALNAAAQARWAQMKANGKSEIPKPKHNSGKPGLSAAAKAVAEAEVEADSPMPTHSAFVTRRGALIVKTYDPMEESEACHSPTVVAVIRGVVARNYQEALSESARRFRAKQYQDTAAGQQFGMPEKLQF